MAPSLNSSRVADRAALLTRLVELVRENADMLSSEEKRVLAELTDEARSATPTSEAASDLPDDSLELDWTAYLRDRDSLLESNNGWYVAYYRGARIALETTRESVVNAVNRQKAVGIVFIHQIVPVEQELRVSFPSPRNYS